MEEPVWYPVAKRGRCHAVLVIEAIVRGAERRYDREYYGVDYAFTDYRQFRKRRDVSEADLQRLGGLIVDWMDHDTGMFSKIAAARRREFSRFESVIAGWGRSAAGAERARWAELVDQWVEGMGRSWANALGYIYIIAGETAIPAFIEEVQKEHPAADVTDIVSFLQPTEKTGMTRLVEELEQLAREASVPEEALAALSRAYGHLGRYYFWGKAYDAAYLADWVRQIREGAKGSASEAPTNLESALALSPRLAAAGEGLRDFAFTSNIADELANRGAEALQPVLNCIAAELGIPYESVVSMRSTEISESLASGKLVVPADELARRAEDHLYWFHRGEVVLDTGVRYREELARERDDSVPVPHGDVVTGQNASVKAKIRGVVRVLHTPAEMGKLSPGEILVTGMTNPSFLPAMQRAGGFITDDGGLLCHAAIVARELKKPCIIGTKVATKALKDGDAVEIDAESGCVRILKRA